MRSSSDSRASPLERHANSHARTLTCFAFFPMEFRGKERLLAVYKLFIFLISLYLQYNATVQRLSTTYLVIVTFPPLLCAFDII